MNIYQQGFKNDILNAIFKLAGQTWLKITGVNAIQTGVMLVVFLLLFFTVLVSEFSLADFSSIGTSPTEIMEFYQQIGEVIMGSAKILLGVGAVALILFVVASWAVYLNILLSDSKIKTDRMNFTELFKSSFNSNVLRVFGASLLMYLIFIVLFAIAGYSATISGFLAFILMLAATVVVLRFFLVIPAMIVGEKTLGEAFAFSLQHITWLRALKILGIGFLAMIILVVAAMIVGLVSMIFTFIPVLGQIIQMGINIFLGGFIAAVTTATMMAMYYRYAEDIPEAGNSEIGLDDLLVSDDK